MQKRHGELPHVKDQPFSLAIADFHQSESMTWSLKSLQCYLYEITVESAVIDGQRRAWSTPVERLIDKHAIPAGFSF